MSEQEPSGRMNEAIAMLSRLSPERLSVDRDRLFFCAGEASARGEAQSRRRWRARLWPVAAAAMAMVAAVLGVTLANREPEVRIVYVEQQAIESNDQSNVKKENDLRSLMAQIDSRNDESRYRGSVDQRSEWLSRDDGLIDPRDRAALSKAFARQLSFQRERFAHGEVAMGDDSQRESESDGTRTTPRTYLEIRRTMQAM